MCRSFSAEPVADAVVDELLRLAQRAPSAGNTQGWQFLVLDTPASVRAYWAVTLAEARRERFPWPGLLRAPVLVVPYADPSAYVQRYGEADKQARPAASAAARAALASGQDGWQVPYWLVDTSMAAMTLLLAAVDRGLGACFFGQFEHEAAVRLAFGVPDGVQAVGTIAIGVPEAAEEGGSRSRSVRQRSRPSIESIIHRTRWRPD